LYSKLPPPTAKTERDPKYTGYISKKGASTAEQKSYSEGAIGAYCQANPVELFENNAYSGSKWEIWCGETKNLTADGEYGRKFELSSLIVPKNLTAVVTYDKMEWNENEKKMTAKQVEYTSSTPSVGEDLNDKAIRVHVKNPIKEKYTERHEDIDNHLPMIHAPF
jgi:hypothetical protein